MVEYKTFQLEVKDLSEDGIIKGYASTFGNIDQGGDVVEPGAFKQTIKSSGGKIPVLADHDPTKQIGFGVSAQEDGKGLFVEAKLNLDVAIARERYSLAKQAIAIGAPMGISIGYQTVKAIPDEVNPRVRRLKEIKLWEYSLVTFPMNQEAMVTAAKNWAQTMDVKDLINKGRELGLTPSDLIKAIEAYSAPENHAEDPSAFAQSLDRLAKAFKNLKGEK